MNPVFLSQSKPDGARLTSMRPPARVAGGELESHWPARPAQAGRRPRPRSRGFPVVRASAKGTAPKVTPLRLRVATKLPPGTPSSLPSMGRP